MLAAAITQEDSRSIMWTENECPVVILSQFPRRKYYITTDSAPFIVCNECWEYAKISQDGALVFFTCTAPSQTERISR